LWLLALLARPALLGLLTGLLVGLEPLGRLLMLGLLTHLLGLLELLGGLLGLLLGLLELLGGLLGLLLLPGLLGRLLRLLLLDLLGRQLLCLLWLLLDLLGRLLTHLLALGLELPALWVLVWLLGLAVGRLQLTGYLLRCHALGTLWADLCGLLLWETDLLVNLALLLFALLGVLW